MQFKSSEKSAPEIAEIFDVIVPTVYALVKQHKENGIKSLETRLGQGRKPITDCSDEEVILKAIEEDSQSVSKTHEAWKKVSGQKASDITFKHFLGTLVQDIGE